MKISEFIKQTSFSIKRVIDMEKMNISHFVQSNKEQDLDVLDEATYNDLIKFLKGRLKLVKRFTKESEHSAEEVSTVYIASAKELGEMLNTYTNNLTKEQQQQTIKWFLNKK